MEHSNSLASIFSVVVRLASALDISWHLSTIEVAYSLPLILLECETIDTLPTSAELLLQYYYRTWFLSARAKGMATCFPNGYPLPTRARLITSNIISDYNCRGL